jgi:DNA-binding SARP family transcriptional activator
MKTIILLNSHLLFVIPNHDLSNSSFYWIAFNTSLFFLMTTFSGVIAWKVTRSEKYRKAEVPTEISVNETLSQEGNYREYKLIPEEKSNAEEEPDDKGESANDDVPLPAKEQSKPLNSLVPAASYVPDAIKINITNRHYVFSHSCICLLPTFCVYSSEGEDITARFQPRLRKILVALIVYSVKDKKGISVKDFTDKFWKDMDKAQRSNNRNVNISNLRKLLKLVGDVKIINKDGFLSIAFGSGVKCDYRTSMKLLHRYNACGDDGDVKFMECITELLNRGPLVTEMSFDWLDESKNKYSSNSLDMLLRMLRSGTSRVSESDVTRIARLMFMHEPTSEKALSACCAVFIKHDKRSIAKNVFLRFCEDFLDIMGEPYSVPFAEFCKQLIVNS